MIRAPERLDAPRAKRWDGVGLASALTALFAAGCGVSEGNLQKALDLATAEFNSGVRWRRYQTAAAHLVPSLRNGFLTRAEENDEALHVSMVENLRLDYQAKERRAELRYRFHWHRSSEGILKKTVVIEEWRWLGERWILARIRQGSGPPFPLFEGLAPPRPATRPAPPARTEGRVRPSP